MRPSTLWRTGAVMAASSLLLLPQLPVAAADGAAGIRLIDLRQAGNLLTVTLLNVSSATASGTLVLQVAIDGKTAPMTIPFTIGSQREATIRAVVPSSAVVTAGIIVDDGPPF